MTRSVIDVIGYAGAVCNAISFVPQLMRVIKLRSARDISYSIFLIFAIGSGLWLAYGGEDTIRALKHAKDHSAAQVDIVSSPLLMLFQS
jgi:uncharacterized protein with PQ loop repeat